MMATDLSLQIQEAITSTIETSLTSGANVFVSKIHKTTNKSLSGLNILIINASFVFEKLTTNFKFVLPARTATMIAYAMLMEDSPPLDTISDDIADAMKESITQICGSLQTVINGTGFADLGKTSFSIGDFEIIDGSNYQVVNELLLFKLSIGEDSFEYFIDFEENFLPFIEELANGEVMIFEESESLTDAPSNLTEDIVSSNDEEEYAPERSAQIAQTTEEMKVIKEDENVVEEVDKVLSADSDEMIAADKRNKKIKIIVIALGAIIAIIIVGFFALLFMGFFDKEEVIGDTNATKELNITKPSEKSLVMADIKNKQIDFKLDMINEERVNAKLKYLTKYEILEEDVLAKYKKDEADRLYKLKMEKLEEFALNNKEESLYKNNNDGNETSTKLLVDRFAEQNTTEQSPFEEQNIQALDSESLMFIRIDPKKYKQYKATVTENKQNSTQVSICKDTNGVVNVYVGPLYLKTVINNIVNGAKKVDKNSKNDMEIITITRGDFNKMCDF